MHPGGRVHETDDVALRRNERFADRPSAWIVSGLEALPRLDNSRTKGEHLVQAFLEGSRFEYCGVDRNQYGWEWRELEWIHLQPSGFFSSHDKPEIQLRSNRRVESSAVQGAVRIVDLKGQRTEQACTVVPGAYAPSRIRVR